MISRRTELREQWRGAFVKGESLGNDVFAPDHMRERETHAGGEEERREMSRRDRNEVEHLVRELPEAERADPSQRA